jgi:hypothetical protein
VVVGVKCFVITPDNKNIIEYINIVVDIHRKLNNTVVNNNKKPTRCTIVLKSLKLYCILIPLYLFRALLRPSSGAS